MKPSKRVSSSPVCENDCVLKAKMTCKHNNCVSSVQQVDSVNLEKSLRRSHILSGKAEQNAMLENIVTYSSYRVLNELWLSYDFNVPPWLESLIVRFANRTTINMLEFHASYNIDTIWAKVYGLNELEFYHVSVHMCIFDAFRQLIDLHRDKCVLLRYACMCDKYASIHVHFVMAALKEANVLRYFNHSAFECVITNERNKLSKLMNDAHIKVVPSLPEHRHIRMKPILSDMHLFNTLRYISTRHSAFSSDAVRTISSESTYELMNVAENNSSIAADTNFTGLHRQQQQIDIKQQVYAFVKRYAPKLLYPGSHFYIFRYLQFDAPMWFASVSSSGIYGYIQYLIDKNSTIDELDKVFVDNFRKCSQTSNHIIYHICKADIPLCDEDIIYHTGCIGRDFNRYIQLGRNEYMYLSCGLKSNEYR